MFPAELYRDAQEAVECRRDPAGHHRMAAAVTDRLSPSASLKIAEIGDWFSTREPWDHGRPEAI